MLLPEQKGFTHLLFILLVTLGIVLGVYLVRHPQIFSPKADSGNACVASDVSSFRECINKLNSGQTSDIEVTATINCSNPKECDFPPITSTRPASIYGPAGGSAGLKRSSDYSYNLLKVIDARNLTISNLTFDGVSPEPCGDECNNSHIAVTNGSDIVLDNNIFKNSKYFGVSAYKVKNLTIKNSEFINNGWFGLWTDTPESIIVENNLFQDTVSNAILGNFTGTSERPSIIRNNSFIHNHRHIIFFVCGGDDGACPGGQIDITSPTNNLIIEKNIIKDGRIDRYQDRGLHAAGVELNGDTNNVTIQNNLIQGNSGSGIALNAGSGNISFNIRNNVITGNGDGPGIKDLPQNFLTGNCTSGCAIPPNIGYIRKMAENNRAAESVLQLSSAPVSNTNSTSTSAPGELVTSENLLPNLTTAVVSTTPLSSEEPSPSLSGDTLSIPTTAPFIKIPGSPASPSPELVLASTSPQAVNQEPVAVAPSLNPQSPLKSPTPAPTPPPTSTPSSEPLPSGFIGSVINVFTGIGEGIGQAFQSVLRTVGLGN